MLKLNNNIKNKKKVGIVLIKNTKQEEITKRKNVVRL